MINIVSAAVIGGDLILGLSDGSVINAGRVQGPTGLTGERGPIGATGRDGQDGNTIHAVAGTPDYTLGRDGDFAINIRAWRVHGPKSNGSWPAGVDMIGQASNGNQRIADGKARISSGESGGGGNTYTTANLPLANPQRMIRTMSAFARNVSLEPLPKAPGSFQFQKDANEFFADQIEKLWIAGIEGGGGGASVHVGDMPPEMIDTAVGDLWYCTKPDQLTLYVYKEPANWVVASPPVSTENIEAAITNIDTELWKVNANIALNKKEIDDLALANQEQKSELEFALEKVTELALANKDKNTDQDKSIKGLEDQVDYNTRETSVLRSRIGDCELKDNQQDQRLDALEAIDAPETKGFTFKFRGYSQDSPEDSAGWSARKGEFWSLSGPGDSEFLHCSSEDIYGKNMVLPDWASGHQELVTIVEEGVTGDPSKSEYVLVDGRKVAYFLRCSQCTREHHKEGAVGNKHHVYYPAYALLFNKSTSKLDANKNYTLIFGPVL